MIHVILIGIVVVAIIGRKNELILNFAYGMLAIMASIRYMYGNDYASYYHNYCRIKAGNNTIFKDEILFRILNEYSPSFYFLIVITSIIFILCIRYLITQNIGKKYAWISIFILLINPYIFLMHLSAIRQCMALCMFIVAVEFAIKKNFCGYLCMIILAICFHKSAMLLLPVYFVLYGKEIGWKRTFFILVVVLMLLFATDLSNIAMEILEVFDDSNYNSYLSSGMGNSVRATILSSIYLMYGLLNLPDLKGKYLVYGKLYILSSCFAVLAYRISMLTRIQMYFEIYSIIIIPYIITNNKVDGKIIIYGSSMLKTIKELLNRYILPCLIILIWGLRYYSFFANSMWEAFREYHTIFSLL